MEQANESPAEKFDTLLDVRPIALDGMMKVLARLQQMVGVAFSGKCDPHFSSMVTWGPGLLLPNGRVLYAKFFPCGTVQSLQRGDPLPSECRVALRHRDDHLVVLVCLWKPSSCSDREAGFEHLLRCTARPTAARFLSVFNPAVPSQHDAACARKAAPGVREVATAYALEDAQHYRLIRATSMTVELPSKDGAPDEHCAAPGLHLFSIAGSLLDLSVADHMFRSNTQIKGPFWAAKALHLGEELAAVSGQSAALSAFVDGMRIADASTCEGIVALIAKMKNDEYLFANSAIPDALHLPSVFPLLVAMSVRLAMRPELFGLAPISRTDALAAEELSFLFETSWSPLMAPRELFANGPAEGVLGIDCVIAKGLKRSRKAEKEYNLNDPTADNLVYWLRAGARCISVIFGFSEAEMAPLSRSRYGAGARSTDELREAVLADTGRKLHGWRHSESPNGGGYKVPLPFQEKDTAVMRSTLVQLLNSVEQYIRNGNYAGVKLAEPNQPEKGNALERMRQVSEKAAERFLAEGSAASSGEAQLAVDSALAGAIEVLQRHGKSNHFSKHTNKEAVEEATQFVAGAFCSGNSITSQFDFSSFICAPATSALCADCCSRVHILEALCFASPTSRCSRCARPRCMQCQLKEGAPSAKCCLRCRKESTAKPKRQGAGSSGKKH